MSIIPDFLVKRVYKKGSLRETAEGIAFDLKNILGPGVITGINFVNINGNHYNTPDIKVLTTDITMLATQITPDNPIMFRLNQEGTLLLDGVKGLNDGLNKIILEIVSRDVGKVQVTLTDNV